MEREFREAHQRGIITVTNGFDEDDIATGQSLPKDDERFGIAHIGTMNPSRNPRGLWKALSDIVKVDGVDETAINIRLIGRVDHSIKTAIHESGLLEVTDYVDYLPHDEVVAWQQGASVLLLLLNQSRNAHGILPGKFFEYMATGRPILCLGPTDSDAAAILKETGAGVCFEYDDVPGMKAWLLDQLKNRPAKNMRSDKIDRFSRRSLTSQLAGILNDMVDEAGEGVKSS
jgi:glycosyltransferase involved in cell wall biosynthesis